MIKRIKSKIYSFKNYYQNLKSMHGFEVATGMIIRNFRHRYIKGLSFRQRISENKAVQTIDEIYFHKYPYLFPILPKFPIVQRDGYINILVIVLHSKHVWGGTATALIFAFHLSTKLNRKLRIICTDLEVDIEYIKQFLSDYNIKFDINNLILVSMAPRGLGNYKFLDVAKDDIFIATAWWTAYLANDLQPNQKFIYFVQDYEPIFYANSDEKLLSDGTYYLNNRFIPIINSKILQEYFLKNNYNNFFNSTSFEPAYLLNQFYPDFDFIINKNRIKRLFFYARPNIPRNLFYLGLKSLQKAFRDGILDYKEWEVYFAGEDLQRIEIISGFFAKSIGKLSITDYRKFARSIDLTLSLMMAPHPSYPPLDFAASGSIVITTKYENKHDLSIYSKNILTMDNSIESLVEGIILSQKITLEKRLENIKNNGFTKTWEESFENSLIAIYNNIKFLNMSKKD